MVAATISSERRAQVRVEPRGAVIAAAPGALLLDLLRQAGLPVSYSCQAGRCGTCRCELLGGDVLEDADCEFRGKLVPGAVRQVLACRTWIVGDCVIGLVEPDEVIVHPAQTLKCKVESVRELNPAVLALRLLPNRPLRFSAGQYVKLDFGGGHVRPYSISSVEGDEALEFHLRRVPGGRVTSFVAEHVHPGHGIKLIGPLGTSYLRQKHAGPMLCVAGGTGLAPMVSIVRTALGSDPQRTIHLYVGARCESELYAVDQLRQLERQHASRLKLVFAVDARPSDTSIRHGLLTDVVAADMTSLAQWKVYLAGPPPMVESAVRLATRLGAGNSDIHADAFYPSEQTSAGARAMNASIIEQSPRQRFYQEISASNLTPLWEVLHNLVPTQPRSPCVAAGWRYEDVRPHLMRAGQLITAQEAERRVLILENPAMRGESAITQTLYAGLQLLLPGEIAPSHRHTQSALRLVLEGEGAYTAVGGERTQMLPGDFVITPSMEWHDHGNPGDQPVVWLDGLDIPLLRSLSAGFAEKFPQQSHPITRPDDDALARFGANLAPMDYTAPQAGASPLFNYRYSRTRSTLTRVSRGSAPDSCHGHALRFLNPTTGATPIPTMGTYAQQLPARFSGSPYRSTDGRVFCCLEGAGRIESDGWSFEFSQRDVFVVPSWTAYRLHAAEEAVLFSFSDRPVQQVLGLWREERIS